MDFGKALAVLRRGGRVTRQSWQDGWKLRLDLPGEMPYARMTMPYIAIRVAKEEFVPWTPTQADMLSSDWLEVERVSGDDFTDCDGRSLIRPLVVG